MQRHRLGFHAARRTLHRVRLDMFLDEVNTLDRHTLFTNGQHDAALAFILASGNDNFVTFANLVHRDSLQHFRRERNDLHKSFTTQFTRYRSENPRTDRLELGIQKYSGIAVELNQRAVLAAHALGRTNDHSVVDFALLHASARRCFFDGHLDDVANASVTTLRAAEHLDAHHFTCTCVVGNFKPSSGLNHGLSFPT